MTQVTVTLSKIHDRIAAAAGQAGRDPAEIRLIAVSKTKPPELISAALDAGQRDFGENYLQEATVKIQKLRDSGAVWHFIGRVQSNKTRDIATEFDWVQTVDRQRIAQRLNDQRGQHQPPLNVCIQVRLSDDPARPGAAITGIDQLAATIAAMPRLRLRGLMCMPPLETEARLAAVHFERTRDLYETLRAAGHGLDTLSMGTSGDLEAAIAAGSTMVRIGTAVFGARA
ncbi:MAG: YggS family pyridoxal phosphate-dependent enzyme [Gammaproteobacteria bacterium]|nr:YggS family pyridoxal phosphate-dependent enzyme [Gammaproteobacteria bacterium]NNF61016.1 YggS family pyridoxal phosphate-dependent enzyme [Gammaproteobacteria bacterium]NNM21070.1 YggS family pyridoxal phosphate-dependent enzyme [Gammaproteobacteria bacterium]